MRAMVVRGLVLNGGLITHIRPIKGVRFLLWPDVAGRMVVQP